MATAFKETASIAQNFKIDGRGPVDIRFVVKTFNDLINGTFTSNNSYKMLMVGVEEDNSIYVLTNPMAASDSSSWQKLASASTIENLSGVFTFKGVAEAISPDQRIITTYEVATTAVTDEKGVVITPGESLYCVTTAYEFDMDVYYGWGASLENIRFWTDTTTVNGDTPQYDKGDEEIEVTAYEFNGKLYYPVDSDVTPAAGDPVTPYESVDGETIYINNGDVFDNQQAAGDPKGEATIVNYKSYNFTGKSTPATLEDIQSMAITASPDNSGHVYQIGENEYASNGQIWVKLGSPVEDWIII